MIKHMLLAAACAAAFTAPALADPIAIIDGKVWTGTRAGTIENGVVIIDDDGEIMAVGPRGTAIPSDATRIDAAGKWVTPGIIAPFTRIGIVEVGAEDSTNEITSGKSAYSVALNAADSFNPAASTIAVTRIEGVTRVAVAPGASSNIFAGQGFIADTSGDADSVTKEKAFLFVTMGEGGAGRAGGSRAAAWTQLRAALSDARFYPGRFMAHPDGDALTRVDAQAFQAAARGNQLMLIEAHRASDLRAIIAFAEEEPQLDIAIVGADEGWMVADELAAADIQVIIDPFSNLPSSFAQLGATEENAARMINSGVGVAFAHLGDTGHQARLALQVAGNAVANGTEHDDAMAALTVVPAAIFGLTGHGYLDEGAVSDVVVWDGDPLEVSSSPDNVIINGQLTSLESRQTKLRDRYLSLDESEKPLSYRK